MVVSFATRREPITSLYVKSNKADPCPSVAAPIPTPWDFRPYAELNSEAVDILRCWTWLMVYLLLLKFFKTRLISDYPSRLHYYFLQKDI